MLRLKCIHATKPRLVAFDSPGGFRSPLVFAMPTVAGSQRGHRLSPWRYIRCWMSLALDVFDSAPQFEAEPSAAQKKEIKKAAEKDPNLVNVSFQGRKVAARRVGDTGKDPIYIGARKG